MNKLILYTTEGCHLCEQAELLLQELADSISFKLDTVDISVNEALVDRYGIRIPVVKNVESGKEIAWPFALTDLLTLF